MGRGGDDILRAGSDLVEGGQGDDWIRISVIDGDSGVHIYHVDDAGDPTSIVDIASLGPDFDVATLTEFDFLV